MKYDITYEKVNKHNMTRNTQKMYRLMKTNDGNLYNYIIT